MSKTEMMKRYEAETGKRFSHMSKRAIEGDLNCTMSTEYLVWLEAKAAAYDRLMSGGKKTPKEVANFYALPIALTPHGDWLVFHDKPWASDYDWFSDCLKFGELPRIIHNLDIGFTGNWKDSLTLPDGWEDQR